MRDAFAFFFEWKIFTMSPVSPPVDTKVLTINAALPIQAGHISSSYSAGAQCERQSPCAWMQV